MTAEAPVAIEIGQLGRKYRLEKWLLLGLLAIAILLLAGGFQFFFFERSHIRPAGAILGFAGLFFALLALWQLRKVRAEEKIFQKFPSQALLLTDDAATFNIVLLEGGQRDFLVASQQAQLRIPWPEIVSWKVEPSRGSSESRSIPAYIIEMRGSPVTVFVDRRKLSAFETTILAFAQKRLRERLVVNDDSLGVV